MKLTNEYIQGYEGASRGSEGVHFIPLDKGKHEWMRIENYWAKNTYMISVRTSGNDWNPLRLALKPSDIENLYKAITDNELSRTDVNS